MPANTLSAESALPELLTLEQAARLCQVSPRTLWTWATTGISPAPARIGKGTTRYRRREYEQWVDGGCQPIQGGASHA